ncbi:MAG: DUF2188 domain-containing protein [Coriobacteriia bacterium]|nr:DUF2188 domain-containing protein [Coriobacteriia bacterium]
MRRPRELSHDEKREAFERIREANKDTIHVMSRASSDTWVVQRRGSTRARKSFADKAEAIEFAKSIENAMKIVVHAQPGQVEEVLVRSSVDSDFEKADPNLRRFQP